MSVVNERVGREIFLYLCLALFAVGLVYAWRSLRRRQLPRSAQVCLLLVGGIFAGSIYYLREIPEEALHLVQYALLSLLFYRALTHRVRDYAIFPIAALGTAMVGMLDEYIQWVVPTRYYDLADIRINFFAGVLAQVGIITGLRPRLVANRPSGASYRRLAHWLVATLVVLMVSFVNTPARVSWYANEIPGLEFLLGGNSMMAQYGYLHETPSGGLFRSRFDRDMLVELDRSRGEEVAPILDDLFRQMNYRQFLSRYSILRDPYVHEVGVHLFGRQYHEDRIADSPDQPARHAAIAYHEDDILQTYFPTALSQSRHAWDERHRELIRDQADFSGGYTSKVSQALITRVSEAQVWWGFLLSVLLLLAGGHWLAARDHARAGS